jgi:hypothetical protein
LFMMPPLLDLMAPLEERLMEWVVSRCANVCNDKDKRLRKPIIVQCRPLREGIGLRAGR